MFFVQFCGIWTHGTKVFITNFVVLEAAIALLANVHFLGMHHTLGTRAVFFVFTEIVEVRAGNIEGVCKSL
jgi:hypothetical protein